MFIRSINMVTGIIINFLLWILGGNPKDSGHEFWVGSYDLICSLILVKSKVNKGTNERNMNSSHKLIIVVMN